MMGNSEIADKNLAMALELLEKEHPSASCAQNTCEICIARKYKKNLAALESFNASMDSSTKFDGLFKKIQEDYKQRIDSEFSELLPSIKITKCHNCKKFVYEPELYDYECHNCGSNLLSEANISVFLKPIKDLRVAFETLSKYAYASKRGGVLKEMSSSIVQIVEDKNWQITSDGLIKINANVVYAISDPIKEHSIGIIENSSVRIVKLNVNSMKRSA